MPYPQHLLPTTVVGSYPQPEWLVDPATLLRVRVPRVRAPEIWRFQGELLGRAQDDATVLAVRDMERAGIDIVTDGEIRRESYSNHFSNALEGISIDPPGEIVGRTNRKMAVPRVVGPIRRRASVEVRDVEFLRRNTDACIKITLPGPFTMAQQAKNEHYRDEAEMAFDFAVAVNEELKALKAAGADVLQLDEPWLEERQEAAQRYGLAALDRALEGIDGPTVVHVCFGYAFVVPDKPRRYGVFEHLAASRATQVSIESAQSNLDLAALAELGDKTIVLGVIDLADRAIESAEVVAARIRRALEHVPAERLVLSPDCGMKYMPREIAFGKLAALAAGARIVRGEL
jgi:5-methyltetrahydropteroyltriglutamate--homocysteine methyltransferase